MKLFYDNNLRVKATIAAQSAIVAYVAGIPFTATGEVCICNAAAIANPTWSDGWIRDQYGRLGAEGPGAAIVNYNEGLPRSAKGGLIFTEADASLTGVTYNASVPLNAGGVVLARTSALYCPNATYSVSGQFSKFDVAHTEGIETSSLYALESPTFNWNDAQTGTASTRGPAWNAAGGYLEFRRTVPDANGSAVGSANAAFGNHNAPYFFGVQARILSTSGGAGTERVYARSNNTLFKYDKDYSASLDRVGVKATNAAVTTNNTDLDDVWHDVLFAVHGTGSADVYLDGVQYTLSGTTITGALNQLTINGQFTIDQDVRGFCVGFSDITTAAQVAAIRGWLNAC